MIKIKLFFFIITALPLISAAQLSMGVLAELSKAFPPDRWALCSLAQSSLLMEYVDTDRLEQAPSFLKTTGAVFYELGEYQKNNRIYAGDVNELLFRNVGKLLTNKKADDAKSIKVLRQCAESALPILKKEANIRNEKLK